LIGLALTVFSKILQFVYKSKTGDLLVIPAKGFFVLAILFSISTFTEFVKQRKRSQRSFPDRFLGLPGGGIFSKHDDVIRGARQILRAAVDHSMRHCRCAVYS